MLHKCNKFLLIIFFLYQDRSMNIDSDILSGPDLQDRTILIIDDNPTNLSVLTNYLEAYGYTILVARDGEDGLERAEYALPDLILLDVLLPGIDGFETCHRLKADKSTKNIPVIFMTSLTDTEHTVAGFEVGGVDYLTKPLQQEEVLARITTHLRLRDLAQRLHKAIEALAKLNVGLEERVERRTIALQESQERFRTIVETIPHPMAISRLPDNLILFANEPFSSTQDIPIATLLGQKITNIFCDPLDWQKIVDLLNQDGYVNNLEVWIKRIKKPLYWHISCRPINFNNEKAVISIANDFTRRKRAEQEKDRLLEQVSQKSEQLRTLSARLAESQETERKRLANELHDRVGQNLSTLGIILNTIRVQLADPLSTPPSSLTYLDHARDLIKQTTSHVRNVMTDLRPPVLDDYGLVAALRWYSHQFSSRIGLTITVEGQEPQPRLPSAVENNLFRITQEALTNVAKHARASDVAITLTTQNNIAYLIIADNGIGFDSTRLASPDKDLGWGLIGMIERAEVIGGHCQIESTPGQGTRVTVEVAQ